MSSRKRKPFFANCSKKKTYLRLNAGLKGFLCTCNGAEKQCVFESYNILNEYADKLYGEEKLIDNYSNETKEEDIGDQFEKEIEKLKRNNTERRKRRFKVIDSSVTNCIFIKTDVENPVALTLSILNDLKLTQQKKTRFLLRMIPVEVTCYAKIDDIKKAANVLFDRYFTTTSATTFSIVFNRRYNSSIDKDGVIKELALLIEERNKDHKADLKHAKLTVVVEILKSMCCISVLPNYFDLCKYNLHSVATIASPTNIEENIVTPPCISSHDDQTVSDEDNSSHL